MQLLHHGVALEFEGFLLVEGFVELCGEGGLVGLKFNEFLTGGVGGAEGLFGFGLFGVG